MSHAPISLSPTPEQLADATAQGGGLTSAHVPVPGNGSRWSQGYYIEVTKLGRIKLPFGDAYLWVICEAGGGYFSKTDYLSRATYFDSYDSAQGFLDVFDFIQGHVIAGTRQKGRSLSNSFDRHVLFHLWMHNVFDHFPKGVFTWKTQLSGLLREKSPALDRPSISMEPSSPAKSKSGSKPEASSSCAPSTSPQLYLW